MDGEEEDSSILFTAPNATFHGFLQDESSLPTRIPIAENVPLVVPAATNKTVRPLGCCRRRYDFDRYRFSSDLQVSSSSVRARNAA